MEKKKITIIGVGGKTGTMFAFELRNSASILGVGKEKEVKMVGGKKLYVEKQKDQAELFEERVIKDTDFQVELNPDIIFLTIKNPVSSATRYYFQKFKKNIPALLISQNGIAAISDTKNTLREIFGKESEKVRLVRVILFNPIDQKEMEDKNYIKYSLPIRIALAKASGQGKINDVIEIFRNAGFEVTEFPIKEAKNLEYSKLFLNLIGMASASRGVSVKEGFKTKEIFREEIEVLKEYIKAVQLSGGRFVNFPYYPVKLLAIIFNLLPTVFLLPFRNILARIVSHTRGGKPKDLDEIDYYNGAVVDLGKKVGARTLINEKVYKRALERLNRT